MMGSDEMDKLAERRDLVDKLLGPDPVESRVVFAMEEMEQHERARPPTQAAVERAGGTFVDRPPRDVGRNGVRVSWLRTVPRVHAELKEWEAAGLLKGGWESHDADALVALLLGQGRTIIIAVEEAGSELAAVMGEWVVDANGGLTDG